MNPRAIPEAQDLARFATQTLERLALAAERSELPSTEERAWLESGARRVREALALTETALLDAAALPELSAGRKIDLESVLTAWSEAVEAVFDGVVANVSANGPLVEALFPHQKFSALRRGGAQAQNFWVEFERRAESGYVRRLCGAPEYAFLPPLIEAARAAEAAVRERQKPPKLPEAKAEKLREQVSATLEPLELALRQTRSLVEAAFASAPALIGELGLDAKPKRRAAPREAAKVDEKIAEN